MTQERRALFSDTKNCVRPIYLDPSSLNLTEGPHCEKQGQGTTGLHIRTVARYLVTTIASEIITDSPINVRESKKAHSDYLYPFS